MKPLLDIGCAGGRAELAMVEMLASVTTGETGYLRRYGRDFWADLDADPKLRSSFDAQMNWRFREQAPQIAANVDWGRFGTIIDVGGGDGALLVEILQAHSGVRGTIVDLPPTAAAATERFTAIGLDDRANAFAGSFFDPLPTGADAYLLSDILHDWDDDNAARILARCAAAAGPDATVVVVEPVVGHRALTAIDLSMLTCFGGRERTVDELAALAAAAGLRWRSAQVASTGRMALEFTPPHRKGAEPGDAIG